MSSLWDRARWDRVPSWPSAAPAENGSGNPWFSWPYVHDNADAILAALREHAALTTLSVIMAVVVALPLAVVAYWCRPLTGPVFALSGVLYAIPSLALIAVLALGAPLVGVSTATSLVLALGLYALLLIVRHALAGLTGVPAEVSAAATGLGYGRVRRLLRIELPLALPSVLIGLRLATVSTVALVTLGSLIGHGGLGDLILGEAALGGVRGTVERAEIVTGAVLCVGLAIVLDLLLVGVGRVLTPWARGVRA